MEAFTLHELNEYIRRVIALNFEAPIWVQCEISQIKESRGHYYLEVVQKDDESDQVIAQSSAAMWAKSYWFIKKKYGEIVDDLLEDGVEIKIKVSVTFHERYGLKLIIEDIDTSFTIGQIEIRRRQIIERLQNEGLLERNSKLPLPLVIQRIAVISSPGAAGLQDFMNHLKQNKYGYQYQTTLFESTVQGSKVSSDIVKRCKEIASKGVFDCIAIIRGGGSRLDLAAFDDYDIAVSISSLEIPVLVGIGHDIDQTVVDLVGHTSLKTPTAVADFIIQHNMHFEATLEQLAYELQFGIRYQIERENSNLIRVSEALKYYPLRYIDAEKHKLEHLFDLILMETNNTLNQMHQQLTGMSEKVIILDPLEMMRKGYSMTTFNGKILTSVKQLAEGDSIVTRLVDGTIQSEIKNLDHG